MCKIPKKLEWMEINVKEIIQTTSWTSVLFFYTQNRNKNIQHELTSVPKRATLKVASHVGVSSMATCLYQASISSVVGHMGTPYPSRDRAPAARTEGTEYSRQISILRFPWEDTWRQILWREELDARSLVLFLLPGLFRYKTLSNVDYDEYLTYRPLCRSSYFMPFLTIIIWIRSVLTFWPAPLIF